MIKYKIISEERIMQLLDEELQSIEESKKRHKRKGKKKGHKKSRKRSSSGGSVLRTPLGGYFRAVPLFGGYGGGFGPHDGPGPDMGDGCDCC